MQSTTTPTGNSSGFVYYFESSSLYELYGVREDGSSELVCHSEWPEHYRRLREPEAFQNSDDEREPECSYDHLDDDM